MKKLIFVTLLLHCFYLSRSQNVYDDYPEVDTTVIDNFQPIFQAKGELSNYGELFKTYEIRNLGFENDMKYADFKVYYWKEGTEILREVAYGKVMTHYRFSTPLKEPGIYYATFEKDGITKMIYIDARTLDLKLILATKNKNK